MTVCRVSGEPLETVLDLGRQPLGNGFLAPQQFLDETFFDLRCGFSTRSNLFQLIEQPLATKMFHEEYAFITGTSRRMVQHFTDLANELIRDLELTHSSGLVVELGCNDGTFLLPFASLGIRHLGVEPSGNVAQLAEEGGVRVSRNFFTPSLASSIKEQEGPARLIYAANVMCHIDSIASVAEGIANLLEPNGLLVFEDPYLGDVLIKNSYDQIYDEHVFLFSALSVESIFEPHGLELVHVHKLPTHGGSMRYTLARTGSRRASQDVVGLLAEERAGRLDHVQTYLDFAMRVRQSADALRLELEDLVASGRNVAAYGATSKSTTIYNYAGIGPSLISRVFDNTPNKLGKFTPGMHIPVVDEDNFLGDRPDVAFLGAWNHQNEIREANVPFSQSGGRWLTHVPTVHYLDA